MRILVNSSLFLYVLLLSATAFGNPDWQAPVIEPTVTTVVESHFGAIGGLIVDQLGYIYVADFWETVWRVDPNVPEVEAWAVGFYGSSGNTLDEHGNLYQSSFYGNYVSRISRRGEVSIVVDENLNGPVGLVFGEAEELYICSCNDRTIKKADADGNVTVFATSEHFNCPNGITKDSEGNLYVVSFSNPKIIKISPKGETSVFADSGGKGLGHITRLRGVFYATSYWDNKVYRISPEGEAIVLAGTGERAQRDGPGATAQFSNPNGIYPDETGTYLYINDYLGDPNASGTAKTPFSLRRIEIPNLPKIVEFEVTNNSIEAARSKYWSFVSDPRNAGEEWRVSINALGWKFMRQDQFDEAVTVFELNVESNPDWWNAHSSLGAGYMKVNKAAKAIKALRRSLELNPDNGVAKERLRQLGVDW